MGYVTLLDVSDFQVVCEFCSNTIQLVRVRVLSGRILPACCILLKLNAPAPLVSNGMGLAVYLSINPIQ